MAANRTEEKLDLQQLPSGERADVNVRRGAAFCQLVKNWSDQLTSSCLHFLFIGQAKHDKDGSLPRSSSTFHLLGVTGKTPGGKKIATTQSQKMGEGVHRPRGRRGGRGRTEPRQGSISGTCRTGGESRWDSIFITLHRSGTKTLTISAAVSCGGADGSP